MALSASEIYVGYSILNKHKHIAECQGCGYRVRYDSFAGVYDGHNVNTCLLALRPDGAGLKWEKVPDEEKEKRDDNTEVASVSTDS